MKRNQGFTLIELIIVIVILGILAVTAAPKFLDFGKDAKTSTLVGVKGALESASALVYGKAIIANKHKEATGASLTDPVINLVYGYPAATAVDIRAAAELSEAEWVVATSATAHGAAAGDIVISPIGSDLGATADKACHVVYKAATATGTPPVISKPVITVYAGGC